MVLLEELAAGERRDEVREDEEDAEHGETFFLCGTPPLTVAPCALGCKEAAGGRRGFGDESFPLYAGFPCVLLRKR